MKLVKWWLALIILLLALGSTAMVIGSLYVYATTDNSEEIWPWVWFSYKLAAGTIVAWLMFVGIFEND